MTEADHNAALACSAQNVRILLAELRQTEGALRRAITAAEAELSTLLKPSLNATFNPPSAMDYRAAWRADHKAGTPGKIVSDPDLMAFILSMIRTATYAEIVDAMAKHFPPEKRISLSSLHRFWTAYRKLPIGQS